MERSGDSGRDAGDRDAKSVHLLWSDRPGTRGAEPTLSYENVNTSLIPPRPRLYGLAGGDVIEQVWKQRQNANKK